MKRIELKWALLGAAVGVFIAVAPACACGGTQCNTQNCPAGCCGADNRCLAGDTQAACGAGASSCSQCAEAQTCTDHVCTDPQPVDSGIPDDCQTDEDCGPF